MPSRIEYLLNSTLKNIGMDYLLALKMHYPNWLLKHSPNIVVVKQLNGVVTRNESVDNLLKILRDIDRAQKYWSDFLEHMKE